MSEQTIFGRPLKIVEAKSSMIRYTYNGHTIRWRNRWTIQTILRWIQRYPTCEIEVTPGAYSKLHGQSLEYQGAPTFIKNIVYPKPAKLRKRGRQVHIIEDKGVVFTENELHWLAGLIWSNFRELEIGMNVYRKLERKLK